MGRKMYSPGVMELDETEKKQEESEPPREVWANQFEFILTCVGFSVGLGNVWRFPYLCYKNGGGAFLIPYILCLVCCGVPIFFMEVAVGQFMSLGGWKAWRICPLMQGIGASNVVIVCFMNVYYIVILTWSVYYCVFAFNSVLPWSNCDNYWNTDACSHRIVALNCSMTDGSVNSTCELQKNITGVDPVVEFWEKRFLQISGGIDEPGTLIWQMVLCLIFVWILVYLCIFRGVKWTGKVVYFTSLFPYVVLTALLIRGVTLDGALDGIIFYLKPDFSSLLIPQVWIDAGTQIFFSYAIGLGALISLGSHNKYNNNCYRQCAMIAVINSGTSLYSGFAIFTILGFMAKNAGIPISEVAEKGPGLVFIAYPRAVAEMPFPQLWAVLFFLMILVLGIDSQFVQCEAVVTVLGDFFPRFFSKSPTREFGIAIYCFITFLFSLCMMTNGGMYIFQMFDYYSASGFCMLWVCIWECVTIGWFYGGRRFYDDIQAMIGYRINPWFMICWMGLAPIIATAIFIFSAVEFQLLSYNGVYLYPTWAQVLGVCLGLLSMVQIPIIMLVKIIRTPGTLKERVRYLMKPQLQSHQLRPYNKNGSLREKQSVSEETRQFV
ncbi:sodium- and chloride-dependent creatine transporter 1-like [Tubulanus polymorphus]|uniref:sodium- and chloride-dependent creatine transporter 1-like n=1 Tax=Tubulanus polymorphus TaxID=672921 RepID=UPI003DA318DA